MQSCMLWHGVREWQPRSMREKSKSNKGKLSSECVKTHSHHQDGDGGSISYSRVVGCTSDSMTMTCVTLYWLHDHVTAQSHYSTIDVPFSVSHLFPTLYATSPLITKFPIKIHPLMDISCPCTVISLELCKQLGLWHYPLPEKESNMSLLTKQKINCEEYVKLGLQLDLGIWKSGVHRMKVNRGLSFPIILGMPFLSLELIHMSEWPLTNTLALTS